MPKEVLHLVTILHPKDIIVPVGLGDLHNVPHLTKSSVERSANQERLAGVLQLRPTVRYVPGGTILDFGKPDPKNQGSYYIRGTLLAPYLSEPRLLYSPDRDKRYKWKIEFRNSWSGPDASDGKLSPNQSKSLLEGISRSTLLLKALWLNPPLTPDSTDKVLVNLVLVPLKNANDAQEVRLRLSRSDERVWIEWIEW